jgi:hypothetical protein
MAFIQMPLSGNQTGRAVLLYVCLVGGRMLCTILGLVVQVPPLSQVSLDCMMRCVFGCRYTLNIETGVLNQPPPDGHWKRVSGMLKDR